MYCVLLLIQIYLQVSQERGKRGGALRPSINIVADQESTNFHYLNYWIMDSISKFISFLC